MTLKEAIETGKPFKLPSETRWRESSDGKFFFSTEELISNDWEVNDLPILTKVTYKFIDTERGLIHEEQRTLKQIDGYFELNETDVMPALKLVENGDRVELSVFVGTEETRLMRVIRDSVPYVITLLTQYEKYRENATGKFVSIGGL